MKYEYYLFNVMIIIMDRLMVIGFFVVLFVILVDLFMWRKFKIMDISWN